jgi:hypothetical protein
MNKTDKKRLAAILEQLEVAKVEAQSILDEQNEAYENMGSRQVSKQGEDRAFAIGKMEDGLKAIKKAKKAIKEAII